MAQAEKWYRKAASAGDEDAQKWVAQHEAATQPTGQ
jgi:TPR repeat protein